MYYICVLGFTLLIQQAHGSWLQNRLESMTLPILEPINNLNEEIKAILAKLDTKQAELEKQKVCLSAKLNNAPKQCQTKNLLSHVNLHSQWDLVGCLNLTGDWRDGVLFSMKFAIDTINITTEVWTTVNTAMNCSEVSFFKVLPCYYNTIISLKDQIFYVKNKLAPHLKEGHEILLNMKKDLKYCLGIPQTLHDRIEKNIDDCLINGPQRELNY